MHRLLVLVLVALGVFAGAALWQRGEDSPPAYVAEHPAAPPESARTVIVSRTMPLPSAGERNLSAMLIAGEVRRPMTGEVMTDTDCTPDAQMISRCRNEVTLEDGSRIVLRHPHDMRKVPCLAPGERVHVLPSGV